MNRAFTPPPAARPSRRALLRVFTGLGLVPLAAGAARAQAAPPQAVVERLHAALLEAMRQAPALGVRGRFERLRPVMTECFDLAAMTRIAVGPSWTGMAPDQQAALTAAFSEWSVATYASRFNGFSGESFATTGEATLRNGDRMVRTALNRPSGGPVQLNYLLRQAGGAWRIVDVYLTGSISELASRRADFAALLSRGGAAELTAELRRRSAALLQG